MMYTNVICPTDINRFALRYNSETVSMVTIPAIICRNRNSKLLGTTKPNNNSVNTCTYKPSLGSKKAFTIRGKIHSGTT